MAEIGTDILHAYYNTGYKQALTNLIEELKKIPTEYNHNEYNRAVWDVINFIERSE
jgi:hypothetical protein